MTKLYELTEAYMELMAQLEDCETAEQEADIIAQIEAVSDDIARKGEAFARICRNLQSDISGYEAEIKRLKNHILFSMGIAGATELHTTIGKWRIAKNPPSAVITDESLVPEEFLLPQPPKLSKALIMAHWKETGEIPEGCDVVQTDGIRFR